MKPFSSSMQMAWPMIFEHRLTPTVDRLMFILLLCQLDCIDFEKREVKNHYILTRWQKICIAMGSGNSKPTRNDGLIRQHEEASTIWRFERIRRYTKFIPPLALPSSHAPLWPRWFSTPMNSILLSLFILKLVKFESNANEKFSAKYIFSSVFTIVPIDIQTPKPTWTLKNYNIGK